MPFVLVSVYLSVCLSTFFFFLSSLKPNNDAGGDHYQKSTSQDIQVLILPQRGPFMLGQVAGWTRDAKALCPNAK